MLQDARTEVRRDKEVDFLLQSIKAWSHFGAKAKLFCSQQNTQRAEDCKAALSGKFPACQLIDQDQVRLNFLSQSDRLCFTGIEKSS